MRKELGVFLDFLREKDLKLTSQREKILKTFSKIGRHWTVEELYDVVKKKDPSIGYATVFRTLKLLDEAGIAEKVELDDKKVRYEHSFDNTHHDHLICTECGNLIEVFDKEIEKLQNKLCKKKNFEPQRHSLEIYGRCSKCRENTGKG